MDENERLERIEAYWTKRLDGPWPAIGRIVGIALAIIAAGVLLRLGWMLIG